MSSIYDESMSDDVKIPRPSNNTSWSNVTAVTKGVSINIGKQQCIANRDQKQLSYLTRLSRDDRVRLDLSGIPASGNNVRSEYRIVWIDRNPDSKKS